MGDLDIEFRILSQIDSLKGHFNPGQESMLIIEQPGMRPGLVYKVAKVSRILLKSARIRYAAFSRFWIPSRITCISLLSGLFRRSKMWIS